ncbi:MAG: FAD-dependent thymidylate synthase, partial [Chloroflexota bacterium]|nr:FAD-dependent thymidylate synthase [Chloroflexota bacterium]
ARLSTSPVSALELRERLTSQQIKHLLDRLVSSGHLSPFEHASFTFAIEGISRATSHQLVRHRLASYTQQSQRYVSLKELHYVTPHTIAAHPEAKRSYDQAMETAHRLYRELMDTGIPAEDARYVLPNAVETRLVMTMNARELMHASSLRLCLRAQWEIVELFENIKIEVQKAAPLIGEELKPKCYHLGYCDEAESCGLIPTLGEMSPETIAKLSLSPKTGKTEPLNSPPFDKGCPDPVEALRATPASLADDLEAMAQQKGATLDPAFVEKMRDRDQRSISS